MVRSLCSRYEAHSHIRCQGCLLYSSLRRPSSLRSFSPSEKLFISQQAPKLDRRKGFSNRVKAAIFAATVINFLLSSLNTGSIVALIIVFLRKALILDIYPLSEKRNFVGNALRNVNIVTYWARSLPVSLNLSLPDIVSIYARRGIPQRCHCHLEGLGPLPASTVGSPHTVQYVDYRCG